MELALVGNCVRVLRHYGGELTWSSFVKLVVIVSVSRS